MAGPQDSQFHGTPATPAGVDISHCPSPHSLDNRITRALWGMVWLVLFRPSPRVCHGWRRFLLRLFGAKLGRGVHVYPSARVFTPWTLEMGEYSSLGDFVDCYCVDTVRIGAHTTVSQYSYLCTASHDYQSPHLPLTTAPITIGPSVWICADVFVGPGVKIGEGAVVGARSSVHSSLPQWMIAVGNPAKPVRERKLKPTNPTSLRINIVAGPFAPMPPGPAGAVEKVWHALAKEFVARGHQVTVLCRGWPDQPHFETADGVRYIRRLGMKRTKSIWIDLVKDFWYSLWWLSSLPRADITVFNVFWLPSFWPLLRLWCGKLAVQVARYPKHQLWLYFGTHQFLVPSQAVAEVVRQQSGCSPHKVAVVPNPINTRVFHPIENPNRDPAHTCVLYSGRVNPEKGLHILVEAMARLRPRHPELKLIVVGPTEVKFGGGGEKYLAKLAQLAGDLPIEFIPLISDEQELARVMRRGDLYCYPSLADKGETFGVAPLEAMALGVPVIVSELGCFGQFLRDGVNGRTFNHRAADPVGELERVLDELLASPDACAKLAAAGAQTAKAFSVEAVADQFLEVFDKMRAGKMQVQVET